MADGSIAGLVGRRPIAPLEMEGLNPGEPSTRVPEFLWVQPTTLLVDETYQRGLSKDSLRLIRKIVEGWDWSRFKPPVVANTPGGLEVIDGQHTAIAAATHGGIAEIPVMVVGAATTEARARSFIGHNRDRIGLTAHQMHQAALVAGDIDGLAVQKVCEKSGVQLVAPWGRGAEHTFDPGDCAAYRQVYQLVTQIGPTRAAKVLTVLAAAGLAPIGAWHILAARFLLTDPEHHDEVTGEELTRALIAVGDTLKQKAAVFAAEKRVQLWRGAAAILFRRVTHGKRRA